MADRRPSDPDRPLTAGTRTLLQQTRPVAGWVTVAALLAAIASVVEIVPLYLLSRAVADVVDGADGADLVRLGLLAGAAGAVQVVVWAAAMYVSHVAAYEHLHRLRVRLLDRSTRLPLGEVVGRHSGDLQRVVVDDVGKIELFVAHSLPELVASVVAWVVITAWLATVDLTMTAAVVAVVAVAFAVLLAGTRRSRTYLARTSAAGSRLARALVDLVDGLLTLAVFDRRDRPPPALAAAVDEVADTNGEWLGRFAPYGTTYTVLIGAPAILLVPVAGALAVTGRADADDVLLFVIIGLGYGVPIVRLRRIWFQLNTITYAAGVIEQVLSAEEQRDVPERARLDGAAVEFERVGFGYGERPVLSDVSFRVADGSLTALVGPSGAGKSTIARLAARFWDVDSGRVTLGGVDVRDVPVDQLHAAVGFVFQETFLFDDTIAANLRVGRPGVSTAEVEAAAVAAHAHDFISALPDGYDTVVGTRGARLSGGERQRLGIARALLHDAPVVVLDEATAFIDPDSEAVVRRALRALSAHRTVVVVAHRLTSVVDADQILLVDDGRIVERGTHDELVDAGGKYRRLWDDWNHLDRTPA